MIRNKDFQVALIKVLQAGFLASELVFIITLQCERAS